MNIDRQEALNLLAERASLMAKGDAPHLAAQHLPENIDSLTDIAYLSDGMDEHLLDVYRPQKCRMERLCPYSSTFMAADCITAAKRTTCAAT